VTFSCVVQTTPFFWMNLQQRWDLYHASKREAAELRRIRAPR
jgi:plasmid maintenance system antidote protein VapI